MFNKNVNSNKNFINNVYIKITFGLNFEKDKID